jgi:hypothetical protein
MMNATDTTQYRDRTSVLVECDYNDDRDQLQDQSALIRLQDQMQTGAALDDNAHETVRALMQKLGIVQQKRFNVSVDVQRYYPATRRTRTLTEYQTVTLSEPLGPYYTKITVPFSAYRHEEVCKSWDENPIETCELTMIPGDVSVDSLRSHRLGRCSTVSLHFVNGTFNKVFSTLLAMPLLDCRILKLLNLPLTDGEKKVLKIRLANWPKLHNILYKG